MTSGSGSPSNFRHYITVVDLTSLGLSNTLGVGLYVLICEAIRDNAGPSLVLSVIGLSVGALISGHCINEHCPSSLNSIRFIIGWNLILELVIGSSIAAKTSTQYLKVTLFNDVISMTNDDYDLVAFILIIIITLITSINIKVVCILNNILIVICLLFASGTVVIAIGNIDSSNWTTGSGFFSHGLQGIINGGSMCAYSVIGIELMSWLRNQTGSPLKIYSTSIKCVFLVGLLMTFSLTVMVTLLVPHWSLSDTAPIIRIFHRQSNHSPSIDYFVMVGAISGLLASIVACTLIESHILRVIMTSSNNNNIIDKMTSWTLACGFISALMALLPIDLTNTLGVGTLLGLVAAPVQLLMISNNNNNKRHNDDVTKSNANNYNYGSLEDKDIRVVQLAVQLDDHRSSATCTFPVINYNTHIDGDRYDGTMPYVHWFMPSICICLHVTFMVSLPVVAWVKFFVWTILGVVVYFFRRRILCKHRPEVEQSLDHQIEENQDWNQRVIPAEDQSEVSQN